MKSYTYNHKITGEELTLTLEEGDVIDMPHHKGVQVEIGPNNTMRGLMKGTPDPKGYMPIPDQAVKELCQRKRYSQAAQ